MHPDTGTLAPFVPRALLARLARPIEVLAESVACTMVFADVSGFTRLSERLARRGNEGGEQLVDVINACFTALLAEAYGRGGSLVKFGGDAMVLLFYDQDRNQQRDIGTAAKPQSGVDSATFPAKCVGPASGHHENDGQQDHHHADSKAR